MPLLLSATTHVDERDARIEAVEQQQQRDLKELQEIGAGIICALIAIPILWALCRAGWFKPVARIGGITLICATLILLILT